MPELPEVHTITTDLNKHISNTLIKEVHLINGYEVNVHADEFINTVTGKRILGVERLAKNILIKLEGELFLQIHLAMTGNLVMRSPSYPKKGYEKLILVLERNGKELHLRFSDMRMFGKAALLNKDEIFQLKEKYGPEPLKEDLTPQEFHKIVLSKKTNIKNLLLDQSKVSGLGNVYAIDALWIARIHPETSTQSISLKQAEQLLEAAREILKEGIKNRGITISDYVDAFGKPGNQQNYFRVYRKEKCERCDSNVEFIKMQGRGTFFCPVCQIKNNQTRLI